ncbi:MAG TPA: hypothetical protein VMJ32_15695 [Pirellulales bacterium]|nr:hypothetical protein [Pirellulales bacterium]
MSLGNVHPPEGGRGMFMLKQSANIYTAMMILAFVFICIGCLFLFLEMKAYNLSIHVSPDAKVPAAISQAAPQMQMLPTPTILVAEEQVHRFLLVSAC